MTKYFVLVVIIIAINLKLWGQKSFLENVAADFSTNSVFVVVPAFIDNNQCYIAVKNTDFYFFLLNNRNINSSNYKDYLFSLVKGDDVFVYNSKKVRKKRRLYYEIINISDSIRNIAENGKEYFINYYFSYNHVINEEFVKEENAIIYFLFNWEIAVSNDCETGLLIINDSFKKP